MRRLRTCMVYGLVGGVIAHTFYQLTLLTLFGVVVGVLIGLYRKPNNRSYLLLEFRSFLNGLYSELIVGQSLRTSVSTVLSLDIINHQQLKDAVLELDKRIHHGLSEIEAWQSLSKQMNEFYIDQFVDTLSATYEYSGNITDVVKHSIVALTDAIDLTLEIEMIMTSKKMEFYIMILMPVILLLILSISQEAYMSVLYQSIIGRIVMTSILMMMILAYFLGRHLIRIKL